MPSPSCQCSRHSEWCASAITQEDLFCDACRGGTCAMRYRGVTGVGWQYHTHVAWIRSGTVQEMTSASARLDQAFPGEGSWISDNRDFLPLHLADAAGRPYLNPDVPWTPHEHDEVPCKYVTGHG